MACLVLLNVHLVVEFGIIWYGSVNDVGRDVTFGW
jgi:hypothetical protein